MSEFWLLLLALVIGMACGVLATCAHRNRPDPAAPSPESVSLRTERARIRELLDAVGELDRGLAAVLAHGPLGAAELAEVDLLARIDRLTSSGDPLVLDGVVIDQLRRSVETIASHPFPAQGVLRAALAERAGGALETTLWALVRDAAGSGAAQHVAAHAARECLVEVRDELERELALRTGVTQPALSGSLH
ncbi:hypothetical protein [Goodfellowiella coeruleoviolacea]|uniref:Uncharacterized protein n=1 Tax=Goodfellowiella coeruleoviolacea TaxID=334858 RepID=A0AAE3KG95_9PSEU|nr:hypothetical protein [Goodfellowiella coeruleoviolacea]MCP2165890.1 hypothetical protein [Goodfellowiella coeruleoviolacea]